ncbi:MAG: hypothetical protein ACI9TH_000251, partial [Kiritimatiellia bacterium]
MHAHRSGFLDDYQTRYYVRLIGTFLGFGQIGCMIGLVGGVAHARDGRRRVRAL